MGNTCTVQRTHTHKRFERFQNYLGGQVKTNTEGNVTGTKEIKAGQACHLPSVNSARGQAEMEF